jgi:GTP-binding protein
MTGIPRSAISRATVDFPEAMPPVNPTSSRSPCTEQCYPRRALSGESLHSVPEVIGAEFLAEARDLRSLPPVGPPEIAIAGRSNVGKSTLLNRLAGRRALARTSKTPGRTRGIVFFDLTLAESPSALRLVDLPGYGYAKVSRTDRDSWQALIEGYTSSRPTLALFAVLIDARRGIEDEERQLYEWLGTIDVPAQIVFTKVDKLSATERGKLRATTQAVFKTVHGARRAAPLLISAESGEGLVKLWSAIRAAAAAAVASDEVATVGGPE